MGIALGLYLTGVSAGLLAVFYGCARCQEDNAYLGLSSLELLLIPVAGMLTVSGLLVGLGIGRARWVVPVVVVGIGAVWFAMLAVLGYTLATVSAEIMLTIAGAAASLLMGGAGALALAVAVGAAALVFMLVELRGPQEWAVGVGVDVVVVLVAFGLGLGVAWAARAVARNETTDAQIDTADAKNDL